MKRIILITFCAVILLSCKKEDNEPEPFRIFTRAPVNMGGTTYMLKGTVVAEGSTDIFEYGFIYTQNASQNNNLPDYNSTTGTMKLSNFSGQGTNIGNFENQALLVSAQYYYIAAYAKIHNRKTGLDEVMVGPHVQLNTP